MKKFKAVIFDMDGVIADTQDKHHRAELLVCKKFGLNVEKENWRKFFGWKIEEIFDFLEKKYNKKNLPTKLMAKQKNDIFLKLISKKVKKIPGAVKFIKNTKIYFNKTAVATSSKKDQQKIIFKHLDVEKYFDVLVHGEDVKKGKPDPEIYILAVKKLKYKSSECLVIEDAPNGVIAAKKAGCKVVGITTSFSKNILKKAGADYVVNNYQELTKIVKEIQI